MAECGWDGLHEPEDQSGQMLWISLLSKKQIYIRGFEYNL